MPYTDKSAQTTIAGLAKHPSQVPPILHDQSATPPEEQDKNPPVPQVNEPTPNESNTHTVDPNTSPSMLLRLDDEVPPSPPPTQAVMSPLPAANRLHAGHTPIFPRSLSPLQGEEEEDEVDSPPPEPEEDVGLEGPLTLPARPGDGSEDRMELKVLDAELAKIAEEQQQTDAPNEEPQSSRQGSTDSQAEVVDGVILKPPRMNMGAPLGQAWPSSSGGSKKGSRSGSDDPSTSA